MIQWATSISLVLLGVAMALAIFRVIRGPSLADRILGLDTISTLGIAVIGVFAVRTGFYLYVDVALTLSLLTFLSTVAFARYLLSGAKS